MRPMTLSSDKGFIAIQRTFCLSTLPAVVGLNSELTKSVLENSINSLNLIEVNLCKIVLMSNIEGVFMFLK